MTIFDNEQINNDINTIIERLTLPIDYPNTINTIKYLCKLGRSESLQGESYQKLEILCKKIDITKRLHKYYNLSFLKINEHKEEVEKDAYFLFILILLKYNTERLDYKFINTILRTFDLLEFSHPIELREALATYKKQIDFLLGDIR